MDTVTQGPETQPAFDVFREYQFIAESTQFLSERRQSSSHVYMTITSAIFVVFGLLVKEFELRKLSLFFASLPLILVGVGACVAWGSAVRHYQALIAWRFEQLRAIERTSAMLQSHRLYTREWEEYLPSQLGGSGFRFSDLESRLPFFILVLYGSYLLGLLVMLVLK